MRYRVPCAAPWKNFFHPLSPPLLPHVTRVLQKILVPGSRLLSCPSSFDSRSFGEWIYFILNPRFIRALWNRLKREIHEIYRETSFVISGIICQIFIRRTLFFSVITSSRGKILDSKCDVVFYIIYLENFFEFLRISKKRISHELI